MWRTEVRYAELPMPCQNTDRSEKKEIAWIFRPFDWMRARLSVKWANKRMKDAYLSLSVNAYVFIVETKWNEMEWNESNVRLNQKRWAKRRKKKKKMKRKPFWPIEKRLRWCGCVGLCNCACRRHHHQHQQLSWHIFIYWWMCSGCAFAIRIHFTHSLPTVRKHKERCEKCFRSSTTLCRFVSFLLFIFLSSYRTHFICNASKQKSFSFSHCRYNVQYSNRANTSIERCHKKKKEKRKEEIKRNDTQQQNRCKCFIFFLFFLSRW